MYLHNTIGHSVVGFMLATECKYENNVVFCQLLVYNVNYNTNDWWRITYGKLFFVFR